MSSGKCEGSIFMGSGNKDFRCFRRPKVKRAEPCRGGDGLGVCSKLTCPPELPSDREESDARTSPPPAFALSTDSLGSARARSSSFRLLWLLLNPNGPLRLSVDLRRMPGRSLRRANRPLFLGELMSEPGSASIIVGAVVMICGGEGAAGESYVSASPKTTPGSSVSHIRAGTEGTGGASLCSFALSDSCESERKRIKLKRRVTGGSGSASSWPAFRVVEGRATSLEFGRRPAPTPSPEAALGVSLSARLKMLKLDGSRVLLRLRLRSLSVRLGRALRGIAARGARSRRGT